MTVQSYNPNQDAVITVTNAAKSHLITWIKQAPEAIGIRLSTKKTGCSGLSYVIELTNSQIDTDIKAQTNTDIKILLDQQSLIYLNGLTIDFVKTTLGQSKLIYLNPNETGKCGCGESFSINDPKDS